MKKGVIGFMIFLLHLFVMSQVEMKAVKSMDLADQVLKVQLPLFNFGDIGFGLYDPGDKQLKVFDWQFKLLHQIPIQKGEGPGEVKQFILSVCLKGDKVYILGFGDRKIITLDTGGRLIKEIPLNFSPRQIVYRHPKLYVFKLKINEADDSLWLGTIINPESGQTIKEIIVQGKPISAVDSKTTPGLLGLSTMFDVGDNGHIYLLNSTLNLLLEIDEADTLIHTVMLPYPERIKKWSNDSGNYIAMQDWYQDMRVLGNVAYTCFARQIKEDEKTGKREYQTHVIKISAGKKFSEKVLAGDQVLIGRHKALLYLFEPNNYEVTALHF